MATAEWLRTFVAVYRSGTVSGGAGQRGLSQPAASQQLAALERRIGLPLFSRTPNGVEPTRRGRELHAQVADSLDRLEPVLAGLDAGGPSPPAPALRVGSSAEFFSYAVLPRVGPSTPPLMARFGPDDEILGLLEHGELDLAVTSTTPTRRSLAATPLGMKRFTLVAPPGSAPEGPFGSLPELGAWMAGRPWVAFSAELPLTRRFWRSALGQTFSGDLRLVAPDLRAVAAAVERGLGISLLPRFACAEALASGAVEELYPVADAVPAEPWFACTRAADLDRAPLIRLIADLVMTDGP
ncbi:MAG TPA: LysR family transcriptional regulator [Acidimicrobiales bacterium]|jgi:DNA-binding transcriptional LysR family regulator